MPKKSDVHYESDASGDGGDIEEELGAPRTKLKEMSAIDVKNHVDQVVELIHGVSGCNAYTVQLHDEEIVVNKKDSVQLDAAMVTPCFPVRIQLHTARGRVTKCTGTLISPLLSPIDNKPYRHIAGVEIDCVESLTDFLFLHLSLGFTIAQSVHYIREAFAPLEPRIVTDLKIELLHDKKCFIFQYNDKAVILKIEPNMRAVLTNAGGVHIRAANTKQVITRTNFEDHPPMHVDAEWASHEAFSTEDCRNAYLDFIFSNIKCARPPGMHPTTKEPAGDILGFLICAEYGAVGEDA